jgi:hypothetical protein
VMLPTVHSGPFVFSSAAKTLTNEDKDMQYYNFAFRFVWM